MRICRIHKSTERDAISIDEHKGWRRPKTMTITELNDGRLLYYPSIEFQNEVWVKAALCVWDHLFRIVPSTYIPTDSDEIRKAVDAGLISDIRLSTGDLSDCAT